MLSVYEAGSASTLSFQINKSFLSAAAGKSSVLLLPRPPAGGLLLSSSCRLISAPCAPDVPRSHFRVLGNVVPAPDLGSPGIHLSVDYYRRVIISTGL